MHIYWKWKPLLSLSYKSLNYFFRLTIMTVSRYWAVLENSACQQESKMHSESRQTYKMMLFAKIVKGFFVYFRETLRLTFLICFLMCLREWLNMWKSCSMNFITNILALSWRRSLSYRNQSTDLQSKSMDWFLYSGNLCHERCKLSIGLEEHQLRDCKSLTLMVSTQLWVFLRLREICLYLLR